MDFINCVTDLLHYEGYSGLCEGLSLLELMVELSPRADLKDNVDVEFVIETAVHLYDVWVVEEHLDLDLASKLIDYLLLTQKLLLDYL